jgi:hypothetical protein
MIPQGKQPASSPPSAAIAQQRGQRAPLPAKPPVPVVVFGVDPEGKPRAARFTEKHADLAAKAAGQMKLQVLALTDTKMSELATRLPAGRIHASGWGLVPAIRADHYAKLLAAAGPREADAGDASVGDPGGASGSPPNGAAVSLPRNWDEIAPGHLVVVQETPADGWYDAIVVERNGDMLTVRWRDYPRDRKFMRHRLTVALLYPDPEASAAAEAAPSASQTSAPAAMKKQPRSQAGKTDQPFPKTWQEIDLNQLVLAKQDGPWPGWWEAIPTENNGARLSLRWRDYPKLPTIVRHRLSLALLFPNP